MALLARFAGHVLPLRWAPWLALGASLAFLVVAFIGGPAWGALQVSATETLAIHLALPFLLTGSLAYAASALRRLAAERSERERLAIEAERRRIAWELHDSAKQRLHAAHLLVSSLQAVSRSTWSLRSAAPRLSSSLLRPTWIRASPNCGRHSRAGRSTWRFAIAPPS